ncbi:MAG: SDR family NAD(P)-dependent oxidoreductase, partial [Desulfobacterales bacterium]
MELEYRKVLVTGAAGFIGFHLAKRLLDDGCEVVGIDNMNPYYDISLKEARLQDLKKEDNFKFFQIDLCDRSKLEELFASQGLEVVVNL